MQLKEGLQAEVMEVTEGLAMVHPWEALPYGTRQRRSRWTSTLIFQMFQLWEYKKGTGLFIPVPFFIFYFESSSAFLNVSLMVSDGSLSRRLTTTMAMTEKKKPGTSS